MTDSPAARLQAVTDRAEIKDLLIAYARGIDRFDRELLASVFHPDATDDHGVFRGTAADFVDWVFQFQQDTVFTQHCITNEFIELDGDVAWCESYYTARTQTTAAAGKPSEFITASGRYVDRMERRDGRWRIADRRVILNSRRITPVEEGPIAGVDAALFPPSRRDRQDISYLR